MGFLIENLEIKKFLDDWKWINKGFLPVRSIDDLYQRDFEIYNILDDELGYTSKEERELL